MCHFGGLAPSWPPELPREAKKNPKTTPRARMVIFKHNFHTKSAILEACRPPGRPSSPGRLKITERAKGPKQTQNFKFCARCFARYVIERAAAWQP